MIDGTATGTQTTAAVASTDVSLSNVIAVLRRHRRLIIGVSAAVTLGTAIYTLLKPRVYSATASFACKLPQMGQLAGGLASQLGLAVSGAGSTQSPQFYADLLQSRAILGAIADSSFDVPVDGTLRRETLARAYAKSGDSPAQARTHAITQLRKIVSAKISTATDVVTLTVTERSPRLAAEIASAVMARLNQFNLNERQTQASEERQFTEQRLGAALGELHAAENELAAFYADNRDYERAPRLLVAAERLQRAVATKQQVYTSLAQSYEQARIDELRDTPVIMPVETAEPPTEPDPRGLVKNVLLALLLSLVAAAVAAVCVEYYHAVKSPSSRTRGTHV